MAVAPAEGMVEEDLEEETAAAMEVATVAVRVESPPPAATVVVGWAAAARVVVALAAAAKVVEPSEAEERVVGGRAVAAWAVVAR